MTKYAFISKNETQKIFYEFEGKDFAEAFVKCSKSLNDSADPHFLPFLFREVDIGRIQGTKNLWVAFLSNYHDLFIIKIDDSPVNTPGWFTFIFSYLWGDFKSQVYGTNMYDALDKTIKKIAENEFNYIWDFDEKQANELRKLIIEKSIWPENPKNCKHIYDKTYVYNIKRWYRCNLIIVKTDVDMKKDDYKKNFTINIF